MGKRPKKNIVLFLVEGRSEQRALEPLLSEIYDHIDGKPEVFFPTMINAISMEPGGDITSKYGVNPDNIENKIYSLFLKDFFDKKKILPKDISEVIHIVDMDGAYIEDDSILVHDDVADKNSIYYDNDAIIVGTSDKREDIIKRNDNKRKNLNCLVGKDNLKVVSKTVNYSVYFFSSNLDHFLHDDANLVPAEKLKVNVKPRA